MEENQRLLDVIKELFEGGREERLAQVVDEAHPADLANILRDLSPEQQVAMFRLLDRERAGAVLAEVDNQTLLDLGRVLDEVELSSILNKMPADDAAEVVDELPEEQAEKILHLMEGEKSEDVQELLEYGEQTAGRLMSPEFLAVSETTTVSQAIDHIRKSISDERAFELYVVDGHEHLIGVVPLRRLLTADPATPVWSIRDEDVMTVSPETDQEEVARVVAKYNLVAVPVVDQNRRLLGVISHDDVVDILREEASEDIFRIAGSDASELEQLSPRRIALLRLPWVLATMLIELGAGKVINYFNATLVQVILLASFMPVIQAISGNTGLQSVTMVVRGLATGQVQLARWWVPLWRQLQTSMILGGVCALAVGVVGFVWRGTLGFAFVVACSMFISVNLSGLVGTVFPMVSKRLGFDPALTAGPFETAFQDVVGVLIFLSLATLLLHSLGAF